MNVKIGKYIIKSDPQCMWIEEEYTGKTKSGVEKVYTRQASGYVRTFEQLLENFAEYHMRGADVSKVKEVLAEFAKCEADIKTLIAAVITGVRRTKPNYCPNCGADMRKDDFKTAIAKEIGCNPEDIKRIIP